ncbi:MAG: ABC transporter permease [Candidatus Aenigmarchaeota archaeon]|nr:ABC transporter permease [Candidatus Aenigmarchaeota archaeon]
MIEFRVVYTMWLREMKRWWRSKPRMIGSLSMPILWLVVMGIGLGSSFSIPNAAFNYLVFVSPGIIGMSLLFTSIFSGVSVIWDRQFGFLKEILVSPVSRTSIVIGKMVGSSTVSLITGLVILFIVILLNGVSSLVLNPISLLQTVAFMSLISFSFVSVGLVIASKLTNMEGFQMIMSLLVMPTFFLSGAMFPIENAPQWMKAVAHIDPLMYGVDGMRSSLTGISQYPMMVDFTILVAFCVVMVALASHLFSRIE